MANSADPGQKPANLDLHCLLRQGISGFSRTRVNTIYQFIKLNLSWIIKCLFLRNTKPLSQCEGHE